MASAIDILLVGIFSVMVPSTADFVTVKCQNSTGYSGQSSRLGCVVKSEYDIKIMQVFWKKGDIIVLSQKVDGGKQTEDERFQLADTNWMNSYDISLLVKDTQISDAGNYSCTADTNRGVSKASAALHIKAKYTEPDMTSKDIKDGDTVELTCVASGGYPRGTVHWFDHLNTNWTRSAKTTVTQMDDESFRLQSTFIPTDASLGPYKCVVYNSEWKEEGNKTFDTIGKNNRTDKVISGQTKNIAAGVVVIGSLIVGLLVALLIFRRRSRRALRRPSTQPMLGQCPDDPEAEAEELNSRPPPYEEVHKDPLVKSP
ncbi:hypothetical protein AALO_G00104850 [Alosa alosa]|uniref:Ig-like domain-containing protein n=1 Tax=Alosa alosa TaxID=278164 RepID=A0AAV6GV32_9TELE|nr:CD276 antigen-like isoform X1 [Alosa alosa]KAG5278983.1 hypothetical protein AALO_G00104850 [Alosa alosa]